MYLLIFFILIFSSVTVGFFGRFFDKISIAIISSVSILFCAFLSIYIYIETVLKGFTCNIGIFSWINYGTGEVDFNILFDPISSFMLLIILIISFCVHLFSIDYMWNDSSFSKFLAYLTTFTFFMALMVTSGNMVQLFIGWEGIGLASFLLINFWYSRPEANRSALKAIIMNKFGDMFFYMFMVLSYSFYKTFDFYLLFSLVCADPISADLNFLNISKVDILAMSLVIAAVGKSAQLGLHSWLPDAMEGPTPVSALLHSATMVTAGIFLIIRCSFIIENSILALKILSFVGIFTSIFSSIIAMGQYDIKKSIAYSTTGQLAYMLGSCGASQYYDAFQHLINHAFFKAVLFLTAGAVIHSSVNGVQDIRDMGKFLFKSPIILICFFISTLSLMGVSGTSGFYSKESIIESFFLKDSFDTFLSSLSAASVALSAYYSLQLFLLIFLDTDKSVLKNFNIESSWKTTLPIVVLTFFGLLSGFFFNNIFISPTNSLGESIYIKNNSGVDICFSDDLTWLVIENLPIYFAFLGIVIMIYLQPRIEKFFYLNKSLILIFNRKLFFDFIVIFSFILVFVYFFYTKFFKLIDRAVLEILGPKGFVLFLHKINLKLSLFQSSDIVDYIYLLFIIFLLIFYFVIIFWVSTLFNNDIVYSTIFSFFIIYCLSYLR